MKKIFVLIVLFVLAAAPVTAKKIVVNLSQQRACAYEGGRVVFCGNISTGKPGHRTPTGHFRVLEKDIDHVSSKYPEPNGGAKMHYMLRVTASGIALHLGYVPNYPASHGCIRMQNGFAQRMYRWASVGTPVSIIGSPPRYVSRSSFSRSYRSDSSSRYHSSPTDILAEFMGRPVRHSAGTRTLHKKQKRRKLSRKRSRKHKRHANPLKAMSGEIALR